jgi:hypothetical protein
MKHDLLAPGLHPLPVPGEPGLQIVLIAGQPAGPAADIYNVRTGRHSTQPENVLTRLQIGCYHRPAQD